MDTGIKISRDITVLPAIVEDAGETLMAAWQPPEETIEKVQLCLDAFDVEGFFKTENFPCGYGWIEEKDFEKYSELTPLFNLSKVFSARAAEVKDVNLKPYIQIYPANTITQDHEFHRDPCKNPDIRKRILSISIFNSHGGANGEFSFINKINASHLEGRSMTIGRHQFRIFENLDENIIEKLSLGNFGMFMAGLSKGLIHKAKAVKTGYRWRVTTRECHNKNSFSGAIGPPALLR